MQEPMLPPLKRIDAVHYLSALGKCSLTVALPVISATGVVPGAIMTESFLSFIGLGVSAPMPSLGYMASDALNGMQSYPLNLVWPTAMICLITLSFNIVGDALRDALDPRMRK